MLFRSYYVPSTGDLWGEIAEWSTRYYCVNDPSKGELTGDSLRYRYPDSLPITGDAKGLFHTNRWSVLEIHGGAQLRDWLRQQKRWRRFLAPTELAIATFDVSYDARYGWEPSDYQHSHTISFYD